MRFEDEPMMLAFEQLPSPDGPGVMKLWGLAIIGIFAYYTVEQIGKSTREREAKRWARSHTEADEVPRTFTHEQHFTVSHERHLIRREHGGC